MDKTINKQYYINKLEKIEMLKSKPYQELEVNQRNYEERLTFYKKQKDNIGTKVRMLEVYQNLWEDLDSQIGGQVSLNEEFWNTIIFSIVKYNKFIQELNEVDYDPKAKNALDKKTNKEIWDQRQQGFLAMKNDLNYMSDNFKRMHSKIHKRTLLQRECIENHIIAIEIKCKEAKAEKERYRNVFREIQEDIGAKGNKMSKQALNNYKIVMKEKAEYAELEFSRMELDLAW